MNVQIDNFKLDYDDLGSGPAVLLIHGFPLDRRMWREQCTTLAQAGYRVIAPDLRGFGASQSGDASFTLSTHADDIIKLMNCLGIGRAVMIGASSGNAVILELLAKYPQRVAGTCLLAPPIVEQNSADCARRLALEELARDGQRRAAIDGLCREFLPHAGATLVGRGLAGEIRQWIESCSSAALARTMSACTRRLNWNEISQRCPLPMLALFGDRDTIAPPPATLGMPFVHHVIRGGGHLFNLECAHAVNRCLLAFLESLSVIKPTLFRPVAVAV